MLQQWVMGNQRCMKGTIVDVAGKGQGGSIFKFKYVAEGKPLFCVVGRECKHCLQWRHMNLVHFWRTIQSFVFQSTSTHVTAFHLLRKMTSYRDKWPLPTKDICSVSTLDICCLPEEFVFF